MKNFLRIEVHNDKTNIKYLDNGEIIFAFEYKIGINDFLKSDWDYFTGKRWLSYVLWSLHSISYIERIPTTFILNTKINGYYFSSLLNNYKYVEFFTFNKNIHVILNEDKDYNNLKHARYQKTFSQFKV